MESPFPPCRRRPRPLLQLLPLTPLLAGPLLLFAATVATLVVHGSTDLAILYSQCQSRMRLPRVSQVPVLGSAVCFRASSLLLAAESARGRAVLGAVLAFLCALLTVSLVESARVCNNPGYYAWEEEAGGRGGSGGGGGGGGGTGTGTRKRVRACWSFSRVVVTCPTWPWTAAQLFGATAMVWELVMVPAYLSRGREISMAAAARRSGGLLSPSGSSILPATPIDEAAVSETRRHLGRRAEVFAISVAVAVGYVAPAVLMLVLRHAAPVFVWLLFPLWVSLVRMAVRGLAEVVWRRLDYADESTGDSRTLYLESRKLALAAMYTLPIACSVAAHSILIWSISALPDDRRVMAKGILQYLVVDALFVGVTVLYWLLVEAGWRAMLVTAGASLLLGPGAGLCVGWIYREKTVDPDQSVTVVAVGGSRGPRDSISETTRLLG